MDAADPSKHDKPDRSSEAVPAHADEADRAGAPAAGIPYVPADISGIESARRSRDERRARRHAEKSRRPFTNHEKIDGTITPACLDCRYDLTGLPDGRCPECGVWFTHADLIRHHRALAAAKADRRSRAVRSMPLLAAVCSGIALAWWFGPSAFAALLFLACSGLCLAWWLTMHRESWIAVADRLLLFIPPLAIALLILLGQRETARQGIFYGLPVFAVVALALCAVALRHSPVRSAVFIVLCGVLPIGGWGLLLLAGSALTLANGHHWSAFDYPTVTGWRPLPAKLAFRASFAVLAFAAVFLAVVAYSARRITVRLRAAGKAVPSEAFGVELPRAGGG